MKKFKQYSNIALFSALFMMTFIMGGCGSSSCDETSRPTIALDDVPPYVISTDPEDNATDVPVVQTITATPSEPLNPGSVNASTFTLTLEGNTTEILGDVNYTNNIMSFNPTVNLIQDTNYTATVTTGIQDLAGNNMLADYVWNFTTAAGDIPPYVISTDPEDNETGVGLKKTITASLSEPLDPDIAVIDGTFTLTVAGNTTEILGDLSYDIPSSQMHFKPTVDLTPDTNYTATVTTGIQDLDGNNMLQDYVWNFTTVAPAQGPLPVDLKTAGDFAILTMSGISNTETALTDITGDIGVYPIDHTAITGFALVGVVTTDTFLTSPYVTGNVYAADLVAPTPAKMNTAVNDMVTAYNDAAGRPAAVGANLNIGAGTLDSTTPVFGPGLYTWGSDVTITNSITLTGNADDTWIFQISGNLILASSAQIILGPNVQAKNIVWQVAGTDVTIGTNAQFSGIVLAKELIAVQTSASVDGRLLSQTAVTLDQNIITQPAQ